jgi:predicted amino acid-binding ACT domain protein
MSARIYQTVHDGALTFLVVVSSTRKAAKKCAKISDNTTKQVKTLRFDMAEVAAKYDGLELVARFFDNPQKP